MKKNIDLPTKDELNIKKLINTLLSEQELTINLIKYAFNSLTLMKKVRWWQYIPLRKLRKHKKDLKILTDIF